MNHESNSHNLNHLSANNFNFAASIISQIGNINIENGIDSTKSFETSKKGGMLSKASDKVYDYQEYAASSNLGFGNNLSLAAEFGDVDIKASNLNIAGNALINTGGNLLITSAVETGNSAKKDQEIAIGEVTSNVDLAHASASAGMKGTGTGYEEQQQASTQKSSNINIGGSMLANVGSNAGGSSPCSGGSGCASIASAEQGGNTN